MKKKRSSGALKFSVFLNVLLLAAALLLFWKGGFSEKLFEKNEAEAVIAVPSPEENAQYRMRSSLFTLERKSDTDVVFVGDGLTAQCEWSEYYADLSVKNRGINGDTTRGLSERVDEIIALKPQKIFLMVGLNDILENHDLSEAMQYYTDALDKLIKRLPKAEIYVQSLLPTDNAETNSKIRDFNKTLKAAAEKRELNFVELYDDFVNAEDLIRPDYTADGIHLMGDAYKMWMKKINVHLI